LISQQLRRLFEGFDARSKAILASRMFIEPKPSLDEVGSQVGLTRERVRQLEKEIRFSVETWVDKSLEIRDFCEQIIDAAGFISNHSTVIDALPDASEEISIPVGKESFLSLPSWKIIEYLTGAFQSDGRWLCVPSFEEVGQKFDERFQDEAVGKIYLPIDLLIDAFEGWGSLPLDEMLEWAESRGYRVASGALVSPTIRSMQDLAAVALEINGAPMTVEEIHRAVASTKSIRSLANQLSTSDQVMRVSADTWGLTVWGYEPFTSIKEAILARVDRIGSVSLDELVAELTSKFGVAESSVRMYAASWPLKSEKGQVTRQEFETTPAGRPFARSKGCFVSKNGLAFRGKVNSEHLRGSGSQFPTALALALGNSIGKTLEFSSTKTGKLLRLSWNGNQATISTIRAELEALDAEEGDEIAIVFESSTVTFSKLLPPNSDPFVNLGRLCLLLPSEKATRISVARSLGLDDSAVWDEILQSATARKDEDLTNAVRLVMDHLLNRV
jgi:hypothetical protein